MLKYAFYGYHDRQLAKPKEDGAYFTWEEVSKVMNMTEDQFFKKFKNASIGDYNNLTVKVSAVRLMDKSELTISTCEMPTGHTGYYFSNKENTLRYSYCTMFKEDLETCKIFYTGVAIK